MGVYIKGMETPTSCEKCLGFMRCYTRGLFDPIGWCHVTGTELLNPNPPTDCPLVPVPPHYDLIDHNALKIAVIDCDAETSIDFLKHAMDCINKAPVVIPSDMPTYEAEEGE